MLKSKLVKRLLKALIALLGVGVALALNMAGIRLWAWTTPGESLPILTVVLTYIISGLVGGGIFLLLSDGIIRRCIEAGAAVERYLDHMSMAQLLSCLFGLIAGMMIAALLSQILLLMGASMFTTVFSAILYVLLGVTGFSVGWKRSDDLAALVDRAMARGAARRGRRHGEEVPTARPKVLDAAALIDGRVVELCRSGFVEGEIVVPGFVTEELRRLADSADGAHRSRGRRGLEVLSRLQAEEKISLRLEDTDFPELKRMDMKLLRLAKDLGAAVITDDSGLARTAAISGVAALNLNDLTAALRPVIMPGEALTVQPVKEGKEAGQGVGYLPDGAMVIVEGGSGHLGEQVNVVVTSAMQTSAGRLIFTRLQMASDSEEAES